MEEEEEKFSDDPEEQLKIENQILKLKFQAELGGDFTGDEDLSPDIENIFLKNVLEFEHQFANAASKTIFEILGQPAFGKSENIDDEDIEKALALIEELLEQKGIVVDYLGDYDKRTKYQFITEELFLHETTLVDIPGMTTHYTYEEFHPNHSLDIEDTVEKFFRHWVNRSFDENSLELAGEILTDKGTSFTRGELLRKLNLIFDAFVDFKNTSFSIDIISYELTEEGSGLGFAEGNVAYDAVLESDEIERFNGPFKLYMQYNDSWNIFFFHWPGVNW